MARSVVLALALLVLAPAAVRAQMSDDAWIAYNQDQLKSRLPDPESTRFRGVFLSRRAGVPVACGEVSAGSATGGQGDYERFVGAGSLGAFLRADVDDFDALWDHFCGQAPE